VQLESASTNTSFCSITSSVISPTQNLSEWWNSTGGAVVASSPSIANRKDRHHASFAVFPWFGHALAIHAPNALPLSPSTTSGDCPTRWNLPVKDHWSGNRSENPTGRCERNAELFEHLRVLPHEPVWLREFREPLVAFGQTREHVKRTLLARAQATKRALLHSGGCDGTRKRAVC
jgi:hypothetical protein